MKTASDTLPIYPLSDICSRSDLPSGIVLLRHLKCIRIAGEDAESFLQSQFSSDVVSLSAGEQQLGAYCNPKGRALAIYRLLRDATGFHMVLPDDLIEAIAKRLQLYRMRAQVDIRVEDKNCLVGHIGESPECPNVWKLDGQRYLEIRSEGYSEYDALDDESPILPEEFWKLAAILSGDPQVYTQTTEQFIPQQVNLDLIGGVSFRKGCYPGQEIIARVRYLGKIKQRMRIAQIENAEITVAPGDSLYSGTGESQKIGTVVDAVRLQKTLWLSAITPTEIPDTSAPCLDTQKTQRLTFLTLPYSVHPNDP